MLHELVFATEKFLTNLTLVRLLLCVNQVMPVEMILVSKQFVANVTLVLLYQTVLWGMLDTSTAVTRAPAQLAVRSCFPRMHRQVPSQMISVTKPFAAEHTLILDKFPSVP
jgi:predicted lysophospholipase L1 biosynthesis ABC-type transport system permease subunit